MQVSDLSSKLSSLFLRLPVERYIFDLLPCKMRSIGLGGSPADIHHIVTAFHQQGHKITTDMPTTP